MENEVIATTDNDYEKVDVNRRNIDDDDLPRYEDSSVNKGLNENDSSQKCCFLNSVDPKVLDILYWKCPKKSGLIFGVLLLILLAISCCSIISVFSYLSLALLSVTFSYRGYRSIMSAVQKTNEPHPFKSFLEVELKLPEDKVHRLADAVIKHITELVDNLRKLFLVADIVDSIKFGVCLWLFTYIGACFNLITVLLFGVICLFSLPKVYLMNKTVIDAHVEKVRSKVRDTWKIVESKVPFLHKKKKDE